MKTTIIKLPNGEAIAASAIVAVRKGDRQTHSGSVVFNPPLPDRVIIDYSQPSSFDGPRSNAIIVGCDTPEERDALAARIITEWEAADSEP